MRLGTRVDMYVACDDDSFLHFVFRVKVIMGETTELTTTIETKPKETDLHRRRNNEKEPQASEPASKKSSTGSTVIQWFTSYFTDRSPDQIDITVDDEKKKKKPEKGSSKGSCFCRHLCCKSILFFAIIYLVMFLRPDYSILVRNSFENVLKKFNLTSDRISTSTGSASGGISKTIDADYYHSWHHFHGSRTLARSEVCRRQIPSSFLDIHADGG